MEGFLGAIFWVAFWFLFLPVSRLVMTPIILVGAIFANERYIEAVKNGYESVIDF